MTLLVAYCRGEAEPVVAKKLDALAAASPEFKAKLDEVRAMLRLLETDDSFEPPVDAVYRAQGLFTPARSGLPAVADVAAGIRELVARLVRETVGGAELAGFRGGAAQRHMVFESPIGEIDLRIEPPDAKGVRSVIGQVDMENASTAAKVFLSRVGHDSAASSLDVDDLGVFTTAVGSGRYILRIVSDDIAVSSPEFDV